MTLSRIIEQSYPRGGRRRSLNQARYSPAIFARCAAGARRLQVAASSLSSGAPHLSSAQSLMLYAISSAGMRSSTSLSLSVHCEPSVRVYENSRVESSEASVASSSALTSAALFARRHGVPLGPPRHAIRESAHHVDRDQQAQIARRRGEIFPRAGGLEDRCAVRHRHFAAAIDEVFPPVLDRGHAGVTCSSSAVIASFSARIGSSGAGDITSSMRS